MFVEGTVLVALLGCVYGATLMIDKNTSCGEKITIEAGKEHVVKSMGDTPGPNCAFTFMGQMRDNCMGLCYDLESGAVFKDAKASLKVEAGSHSKIFTYNDASPGPWCSDEMTMSVTLTTASDYVYDPKNPSYKFTLAVYNKCGQPNIGRSITFEQALENLDNYHHGEKFHDNVHRNMVHGILVGTGLACIFLIILLVTYCYYKHSPNRGRSRSVGMPKVGFSKKMDVKKESKKSASEEPAPAHYKYTPSDPERVERQPEIKPLLSSADPEKPPAEAKFDPAVDPPYTPEADK